MAATSTRRTRSGAPPAAARSADTRKTKKHDNTKQTTDKQTSPTSPITRPRVVWVALVAAMTLVGGSLLALQGRPAPRLDGLSLSAPVAAAARSPAEAALNTRIPLDKARWSGIMIHHSGNNSGSAASIQAQHERLNFRGLGHHFIIGNGAGMGDGEIHVGYRWLEQLPGAHAAGPEGQRHNLETISICLVGDGNRRPFTPAQMRRLVELVTGLQAELGLPANRIILHRDAAAVDDPGRLFPELEFRAAIAN